MQDIHTILTHPGGAHKDDVLAVSVLIAMHRAPVVRREPTPADLDDPGVAIVDVGGSHDPSRSNFDHHHFPREHPPTCALSLLLQALGLYEDALLFCPWMETAEWFDSRGPNKTAEWLGAPRSVIDQLASPVDGTLLRRFAQASALSAGDPVYEFMGIVGDDLLTHLRTARARLDAIDARVERWDLKVGEDVVPTLFLARSDADAGGVSQGLHDYIRAKGLGDDIAAIVYPDRRGSGYGIQRYEDHPRLDFQRIADEPDVHFAHVSGFVCKTSAAEPERLKQLVAGGWSS